jgi:hypothetical protein
MNSANYFVCTFVLTHGAMLALGAHELWTLRRGGNGGRWRDEKVPDEPKPKPLPDCLIPKLGPMPPADWQPDDWVRERERDLELV